MAVPDFQSFMLPVLKACADAEVRIGDVIVKLADDLAVSEADRSEMLPSWRQTVFADRVHWAKAYLARAGLIDLTKRTHFQIKDREKAVLAHNPAKIDIKLLSRFEEFRRFRSAVDADPQEATMPASNAVPPDGRTPDEIMRWAHQLIEKALREDLLRRILAAPFGFFEGLIVKLLIEMGYGGSIDGAGRSLGKPGDDGVDGVIDQDPLGLDRVYIQAKRYAPGNPISPSQIRDFFGSLDRFKAAKGLFVTTSTFLTFAKETA